MFKELSREEYNGLTDGQKSFYLDQKKENDSKVVTAAIDSAVDSKVSAIKSEIESENEERLAKVKADSEQEIAAFKLEFTKTLAEQGLSIAEIEKRKNLEAKRIKSTLGSIEKSFKAFSQNATLEAKNELLSELNLTEKDYNKLSVQFFKGDSNDNVVQFVVPNQKAVFTSGTGITNDTNGVMLDDLVQLPTVGTPMQSSFIEKDLEQGKSGELKWYEYDDATTVYNATAIAENTTLPESSIGYEEQTARLKKVSSMIPVTDEALTDFSFLLPELESLLWRGVMVKKDYYLLKGVNDAIEVLGVETIAALNPFTLGAAEPFFQAYASADIVDLINSVASMISEAGSFNKGEGSYFNANACYMHPHDIQKYFAVKDANFNLRYTDLALAKDKFVSDIRIVSNPNIVEGTFTMGDTSVTEVYNDTNIGISMGYGTGDFESDRLRAKLSLRFLTRTRNMHFLAYMKVVNIGLALADITTP